jgi:hypothetical protein
MSLRSVDWIQLAQWRTQVTRDFVTCLKPPPMCRIKTSWGFVSSQLGRNETKCVLLRNLEQHPDHKHSSLAGYRSSQHLASAARVNSRRLHSLNEWNNLSNQNTESVWLTHNSHLKITYCTHRADEKCLQNFGPNYLNGREEITRRIWT